MAPETPRPAVLGVGGSPRKGGNSDLLLHQILTAAGRHLTTTAIQLRELTFTGCIGCERCRKEKICAGLEDDLTGVYPDLLRAQGLVLVCPTHHYNITAWMKAFIDRLYCFYDFANTVPRDWSSRLAGQGRRAVLAAVCEQASQADMGFTLDAMRLPLKALGYEIVAEMAVFNIFARGTVGRDARAMANADRLGADLAASLRDTSAIG